MTNRIPERTNIQRVAASDARLLRRFRDSGDEAAFLSLVTRHGPMVLGVCRRVLGNVHDAEDAFQATFLVLAHKAASIQSTEAVGGWLYRVAHRTAIQARRMIQKRQSRVREAVHPNSIAAPENGVAREVKQVLDEELLRLPEKLRTVIVLCDLSGRTRREAASELRIPLGTVTTRLARGRELLRNRLTRRGITIGAAALTAIFSGSLAQASVPPALALTTVKAASVYAASSSLAAGTVSANVATLTQGVLSMMSLAKAKLVSLALAGVTALGGLTVYSTGILTASDSPAPPAAANGSANISGQGKYFFNANEVGAEPGQTEQIAGTMGGYGEMPAEGEMGLGYATVSYGEVPHDGGAGGTGFGQAAGYGESDAGVGYGSAVVPASE